MPASLRSLLFSHVELTIVVEHVAFPMLKRRFVHLILLGAAASSVDLLSAQGGHGEAAKAFEDAPAAIERLESVPIS